MPTLSRYYTPTHRFVTSTGEILYPSHPFRYCGQMAGRIQLQDAEGRYCHITEDEFDQNMELLPASRYRAFKRGQRFASQLFEFAIYAPARFLKRCLKGCSKLIGALIEGIAEGIGSLFD